MRQIKLISLQRLYPEEEDRQEIKVIRKKVHGISHGDKQYGEK